MATYEYTASAGDASILGMDVFAVTWTGGSATITAVKAKFCLRYTSDAPGDPLGFRVAAGRANKKK